MADVKINRGGVLIAEPFMLDPNFKRAVILVCEHQNDGSLGFILNKSLDMKINDLIADFPEFDSNVYYGGPVQTDTVHYVHNVGGLIPNSNEISGEIFWGGDFELLKKLIKSGKVKPENIRFFVGYTGWSSGQLTEEMKYGSWVSGSFTPDYLFKDESQTLWMNALNEKGNAYSVIAQMPEALSWN
ncbi:MAG: putative transcriptional regulator [Polaribacter sp.]|jgi:putative transcriptional regulator